MSAVLSAVDVLNACRHARRIGETLGERMPLAHPEALWPTTRSVLGLPPELAPEQERQVFDCFSVAHRSSATMRVAAVVDDAPDNKRTQVFRASPARGGFSVATWIDPGPPDEEPVVTPLTAAAALARSLRDWWRPKPDPAERVARETLAALAHECMRHKHRVESIAAQLERARGRR